ncbi:MAG: XTP/dITP diphosphatase [Hydrogenibacillus sp.]|nr:XTP/dITP diphosphatase [Hydrogenibacillus sp.]
MEKRSTLLLATHNAHKAEELRALLAPYGIDVETLADVDGAIALTERGKTFQDNALEKARTVAAAVHRPVLADDSGLEVFALGGAPGVYSARYAGEPTDDARNNAKLLAELDGIRDRRARFVSVLAFVAPNASGWVERTFSGELEGEILTAPRGTNGFGYDPLFFVPTIGRTLAELAPEEKNAISHRARAFEAFVAWIEGEGRAAFAR